MMPRVVVNGVNGEFFDGSDVGLIKALSKVAVSYDTYAKGARNTKLPCSVEAFEKVFVDILAEK